MPDLYYLEGVSYGCGNPTSFEIYWNGARMIVHVHHNPSPDAVENGLMERLHIGICSSGDEKFVDEVEEEILDVIVKAGEALLNKLAPPDAVIPSDLHTTLFPPQCSFRLVTKRDELQLLVQGTYCLKAYASPKLGFEDVLVTSHVQLPEPKISTHLFELDVKCCSLPRHTTTNIEIVKNLLGNGHVSHVAVNGAHMCAKVGIDPKGGSMQRELDCLAKITAHATASAMRINVPKLLGLVELPNSGKVIGTLEELIPARETQELATLARVDDICVIPTQRREAWAKQIQQTISWLHGMGVVWGDGKADNVLIHPDTDEAWLVDFGGSWTHGWVDKELAETVDGDNQALRKILDFLQV